MSSPEELIKMVLQASEQEYKAIKAYMENGAKQGQHSAVFPDNLSDGAIAQLKAEGFSVKKTVLKKCYRPR